MKRILLFTPFLLLTALFVSRPPRYADSQPFRVPPHAQDTTRRIDSGADLDTKIDSVNKKAVLLKEKTIEIRQGSVELEKQTRKLLNEVKKDRDPEPQIVVIEKKPDTIIKADTTCVYLRDSVYSSLPWWKKYRILLKQCTIKQKIGKLFKRRK